MRSITFSMFQVRAPTVFFASAIAFLVGCSTATEQALKLQVSPAEQARIGARLEERLFLFRQVKPTFTIKTKRVERFERQVVAEFIDQMPSGNLIFGGFPAFQFVISKRQVRVNTKIRGDFAPVLDVIYSVNLQDSDEGRTIFEAEYIGRCIESEAIYTSPTRCSLLRPFLLRKALEKL